MVDRDRARGDRGARAGDRAHAPAADRRPTHPPGRRCRGTGASAGRVTGDTANDLGVLSGDPNVSIQEAKAFTCNVRAGPPRAARRPRKLAGVRADPPASRPTATHPAEDTEPRMTEIAIERDGAAADGLLHRHDGVHRLQGVRGRLQAVERPALRRRRRSARAAPTTTPASLSGNTWRHVRFVELADAGGGVPSRSSPTSWRRRPATARRSTSRPRWRRSTTGSSCPTSASTARTPAAWTRARPAR